jgi:uncharacterized protein with PQ loop repeat
MVLLERSINITLFQPREMDAIGSVAAACTTISQGALRAWRRKSAIESSLTLFLLVSFGVARWMDYGIGHRALPNHWRQPRPWLLLSRG